MYFPLSKTCWTSNLPTGKSLQFSLYWQWNLGHIYIASGISQPRSNPGVSEYRKVRTLVSSSVLEQEQLRFGRAGKQTWT